MEEKNNSQLSTLKSKGLQSGQALVEYVLLLSIIVSLSALMIAGIKSARDKMWKKMLCEVSAACSSCKSTETAKKAFPTTGGNCKN